MSHNVHLSKHFLHLLLTTSRLQALSLILSASDEQINTLIEIAHNLLILPLNESEKIVVNKRRTILKNITKKNLSKKQKRNLIYQYRNILLKTLLNFKDKLIQLLQ